MQLFSQDCCELTCPHPIFHHFSISFCVHVPIPHPNPSTHPCLCEGAAFNCSIPGWAPNKTKETEIGQSAEDRRGSVNSFTLAATAKTGSMEILAFRASVRFAVAANIYKHMICLAQQKQQMKKLPHLQTRIHQNSCKNFKSCSLQNQFGAGMLHSFVRQLSSSYMQGWICGQRGERQQD